MKGENRERMSSVDLESKAEATNVACDPEDTLESDEVWVASCHDCYSSPIRISSYFGSVPETGGSFY